MSSCCSSTRSHQFESKRLPTTDNMWPKGQQHILRLSHCVSDTQRAIDSCRNDMSWQWNGREDFKEFHKQILLVLISFGHSQKFISFKLSVVSYIVKWPRVYGYVCVPVYINYAISVLRGMKMNSLGLRASYLKCQPKSISLT